jgi:pentatricopeptide repeat protein
MNLRHDRIVAHRFVVPWTMVLWMLCIVDTRHSLIHSFLYSHIPSSRCPVYRENLDLSNSAAPLYAAHSTAGEPRSSTANASTFGYHHDASSSRPFRKSSNQLQQQQQQTQPRRRGSLDHVPSPEWVELQMTRAIQALRIALKEQQQQQQRNKQQSSSASTFQSTSTVPSDTSQLPPLFLPPPPPMEDYIPSSEQTQSKAELVAFPTVRECNAALATWGDAGDLRRALRLFGKMRQAAALAASTTVAWRIPAPTLVTYSTLMSRANKMDKPHVALRLWQLLLHSRSESTAIVPDIKAANILLHSYAKAGTTDAAAQLWDDVQAGRGMWHSVRPNVVTLNTFLYACQQSGSLDRALQAFTAWTTAHASHRPDARTFTTLMATVARRPHQQAAGQYDPSLAFTLYETMTQQYSIVPNGMTYSALIDACGRCRRVDLALQGLRMMLRHKARDQARMVTSTTPHYYTLPNEVGAWTAAINACGKAGRLPAAMHLFYTMENFGCEPNTVTCGCLTDSLLRAGMTGDTLQVLRYMQRRGLVPSEVMYTSLMTHAERLVQVEQTSTSSTATTTTTTTTATSWRASTSPSRAATTTTTTQSTVSGRPMNSKSQSAAQHSQDIKAIEVYTELMQSLVDESKHPKSPSKSTARNTNTHSNNSWNDKDTRAHTHLLKVFLVFQQMKAAGAHPDLACYNVLLSACARAGDLTRAHQVLGYIVASDDYEPNDTTWREMIRTAAHMHNSTLAQSLWHEGLSYRPRRSHHASHHQRRRSAGDEADDQWRPSADSFGVLLSAYIRQAIATGDSREKEALYQTVVSMYEDLLCGSSNDPSGIHSVDVIAVLDNQRTMLYILQAVVHLENLQQSAKDNNVKIRNDTSRAQLRSTAASIAQLECLQTLETRASWSAQQALQQAQSWI